MPADSLTKEVRSVTGEKSTKFWVQGGLCLARANALIVGVVFYYYILHKAPMDSNQELFYELTLSKMGR